MISFRAVDKDVYRSRQPGASSDLISKCSSLVSALNDVRFRINSGAGRAKAEFRGYFRQLFDNNLNILNADADNLIDALQRLSQGLRNAKRAAKAEQERIDRALDWQRRHDDWQRQTEQGGIGELWYDLWHSEPEIPDADMIPGDPPVIPAKASSVGSRDVPPPGSTAGACGVSSACPDDLESLVTVISGSSDTMVSAINRFVHSYEQFESAWTWKSGPTAISGMEGLIGVLRRFNENNVNDGRWLGLIAGAFRAAGGGGSVASLSDQALSLVLQNAGVSASRQALEVPPLALVGMAPTTGFADDPINTATGNFVEPETDIAFPSSASALAVTRTYNSIIAVSQFRANEDAPSVGVFGLGWSSILDQRLIVSDNEIEWVQDDGRHVLFSMPDSQNYGPIRAVDENFWIAKSSLAATSFAESLGKGLTDDVWLVSNNEGCRWAFSVDGSWLGFWRCVGDSVGVERSSNGLVKSLIHCRGRRIDVEYDGALVSAIHSSDGRKVDYQYSETQQLISAQGLGGVKRNYVLDDQGLIEQVVGAGCVVECVNTYDKSGRITSQVSQFGRKSRYVYLPGHVACVSDEDGSRANTWISDNKGRTVGIIDAFDQRQSMSYDRFGNLVTARDRCGKLTVNFYDDRGRLTRTVLPTKAEVNYCWDEQDRLEILVGANGATVSYRYADTVNRFPSQIVDPCGGLTTLHWVDGLLLEAVDPEGVKVSLGYNDFGELVSVTNGVGDVFRLVRDEAGRVIQAITPLGNTTQFIYGSDDQLSARIDPDGARWGYEHDSDGRLISTTDPAGATTRVEYGSHGQAEKTTDPLGRVVEREFDDLGNVSSLTLPDDSQWAFEHDGLSRLKAVIDPAGGTWHWGYDADGRLTSFSDPTGIKTQTVGDNLSGPIRQITGDGSINETVEFDDYGRPVKAVDAAGGSELIEYDACGRVVEITDAAGGRTRLKHDLAGRIVEKISPENHSTRFSYDSCGRQSSIVAPDDGVTRFFYDADSRLIKRVDACGDQATYAYDSCGRLVSATVPGLGKLERKYDSCGRLTHSRDLVTGVRHFSYDAAGQLVKVTNGLGGTTRYTYDERGRLSTVTDPAGGLTKRQYNGLDKITALTDPLGRITAATYDEAGRQLSQTDPDDVTLSFTYDSNGDVQATYANGKLLTKIERNLADRTLSVIDNTDASGDSVCHRLRFDELGRLIEKVVEKTDSKELVETSKWAFNRDGQPTDFVTSDGQTVAYNYDVSGNLTEVNHTELGQAKFGYDACGRLLESTHDGLLQQWFYSNGFITRCKETSLTDGEETVTVIERNVFGLPTNVNSSKESVSYSYDDAFQLTGLKTSDGLERSWSYDFCGRVLETSHARLGVVATTGFFYDEAGQLSSSRRDSGGRVEEARYCYSGAGRRSSVVCSGGQAVGFGWDERGWLSRVAVRVPGQDVEEVGVHVDGLGQLGSVGGVGLSWNVGVSGRLLAGVGGRPVCLLPDGTYLGRPQNNAGASWRPGVLAADPFEVAADGIADSNVSGVLSGLVGLGACGLVVAGMAWLGARVYDSDTFSFLSPDPLADPPAGVLWASNPYNYAANNPLVFSDPAGYKPVTDAQLRAYNQNRARSGMAVAGDFVADNWEYVAAAAAIAGGVALMATGVGGPAGIAFMAASGALLSGGVSIGVQKYSTGNVDWTKVGQDSAVGAVTGLIGGSGFAAGKAAYVANSAAGNTSKALLTSFSINAASGAASSEAAYLLNSRIYGTPITASGMLGAAAGGSVANGLGGFAGPAGNTLAKDLGGVSSRVYSTGLSTGSDFLGSAVDDYISEGQVDIRRAATTSLIGTAIDNTGQYFARNAGLANKIELRGLNSMSQYGIAHPRTLKGITNFSAPNTQRLWYGTAYDSLIGFGADIATGVIDNVLSK